MNIDLRLVLGITLFMAFLIALNHISALLLMSSVGLPSKLTFVISSVIFSVKVFQFAKFKLIFYSLGILIELTEIMSWMEM